MRFPKGRKDANHSAIVNELRSKGVEVVDLSASGKVPDTLLHYRGFIGFAEIKTMSRNTAYSRSQLEFISTTKIPCAFVKTAEEAWDFITLPTAALTQKQKDAIAGLLATNPAKQFHPSLIERTLDVKEKVRTSGE